MADTTVTLSGCVPLPCCGCARVGENDLEILLSGTLVSCGCTDMGDVFDVIVDNFTGIIGAHTVPFFLEGVWRNTNIGTARVRLYTTGTGCAEPLVEDDYPAEITITCQPDGTFSLNIVINDGTLGPTIFDVASIALDGTEDNERLCGNPLSPVEGAAISVAQA
jgi:hypothetical protein